MGWFSSDDHGDRDVPAEVTDAAIQAFTRRGVTVVIDPSSERDEPVLMDAGRDRKFGLGNLISMCRTEPIGDWDGIIDAHVGRVIRGSEQWASAASLPEDELRERIRTRLVTAAFADHHGFGYARPFAADLVVALAMDMPDTVAFLSSQDVDELSIPIDTLYQLGQENTNVEFVDEHVTVEAGSNVWAMSGDSLFIASQVADMEALVENRIRSAPLGVVFGIPDRSLLFYTAPRDETALEDITTLVELVDRFANRYPEPPGRLSASTFYWDEGKITPVGGRDTNGDLIVDASGPFGNLLQMIAVMNQNGTTS